MINVKGNGINNATGLLEEVECPPDASRVVAGLRDTGYDFNTAVADIIDNSIAAAATHVDVRIVMNPSNEVNVYIADNGTGMDSDGLKNAMKYGSKERPDAESLGKFGLGLKTASTAFCRCLSVITRGEDNVIRKAQWDLDYIEQTNDWKLKMLDVTRDERELLQQTAGEGTGTLVVWDKIDRLMKLYINQGSAKKALNRIIYNLKFHVSMVYQRFLDVNDKRAANVSITINDENIEAWDPFLEKNELTECVASETLNANIADEKEAPFTLRAFVLPNKNSILDVKERENARISNDMQGFYVYRENRLIYYGNWLGMFTRESHLSLLRVEFSFDHRLDEAFNVDIKKSRIFPAEEIIDYIEKHFITAPRRAAEDRYRHGTVKEVEGRAEEIDAHAESNKNIEEKAQSVENAEITVKDPDKEEVEVKNPKGTFSKKITIVSNPEPGKIRVIPKSDLEHNELWKPCIVDGKQAVMINQSHPYYQKIYTPVLEQNVMVTGMDALLWALAEAENEIYNDSMKELYEDMRISVSRILKKLVEDLPDPNLEDDGRI